MLKQLTLKNFLLVDALDIDFNAGFTTITGESGAGKSILLNALGLLLGNRASADIIRPGADKADVSAEFDLGDLPGVQAYLEGDELEDPGGHCLIRRVIASNGRSRAFVNDVPVTSAYLRGLGEQLVDIHGQHEHLRLADRTTQLNLLDDFTGVAKLAAEVKQAYRTWQTTLTQIHALEDNLAAAADRQELLSYQLSELEELDPQADEFAQLENEHKRLSQAHKTLDVLHNALNNLDELDALRQSARAVESIDDTNAELISAQSTLATILGLLDDASRDLRRYEANVVIDPETLQTVEERLNRMQELARKHRISPNDLSTHTQTLRDELNNMDADNSALQALIMQAEEDEQSFNKQALSLSRKRKKAAPEFAAAVSGYMQSLGINQGAFDVVFGEQVGEHGLDRVDFHVTTNASFAPGPLTQIASGGEQTRIGLSIQIVAAQNSALPCLILDEADVGVGGTTADTVGRILRDLGRHTQVICITHAPQVAALGNNHYRVVKEDDNTTIHALDKNHRIEELARMLAGSDITQKTRNYATTLLKDAAH
jgi:DNA repair protein RecN (Recombination protein N)